MITFLLYLIGFELTCMIIVALFINRAIVEIKRH